jgi:NACHT domain
MECLLIGSYCSSLVVDHLSKSNAGNPKVGIVCLYCDYRDQKMQDAANMIGSLVKQLVMLLPKIPGEIFRKFRESKKQEKRLELGNAGEMLILALQSFDKVYICVDALDECERDHRRNFLEHLSQLLQSRSSTRTCLFLTGRPQIENDVNECLGIEFPDSVRVEANKNDIMKYLSYEISKDPDRKAMNEKLREEILNTIADGSEGMYVSRNNRLPWASD